MRNLAQYALSIGAATLLVSCGGSQLPTGARPTSAQLSRSDDTDLAHGYQVLHRFNNRDGKKPLASLIGVNGKLFGTTENGG